MWGGGSEHSPASGLAGVPSHPFSWTRPVAGGLVSAPAVHPAMNSFNIHFTQET